MLTPQKTLEREALLKRIRELEVEVAQHERNLREREARLPIEEQFRLSRGRFIEPSCPVADGQGSSGDPRRFVSTAQKAAGQRPVGSTRTAGLAGNSRPTKTA